MVAATTALGPSETPSDIIAFHYDSAAKRLGLTAEVRAVLAQCTRQIEVSLPVRMDDGTLRLLKGYRAQHSEVRGPYFGGFRIMQGLERETLAALARHTTAQCALANAPFGGARGGIDCNRLEVSEREMESAVRTYTARMHLSMGGYRDIHCIDAGSDQDVMGWMLDEYSHIHEYSPACVSGKRMEMGGVPRSEESLARSVVFVAEEVARDAELEAGRRRVAVQGVGKKALEIATALARAGWKVVAVSDQAEAIWNSSGLDMDAVLKAVACGDKLGSCGNVQRISVSDLLECDCNVLVAAAGECALKSSNARRIKARIIVEAAGLTTTVGADQVLRERGCVVVPELVTGVGPVTVAHLEWNQNVQQVYCEEEKVLAELERSVARAYKAVKERAAESGTSWREAAYDIAIQKLARAEKLRLS